MEPSVEAKPTGENSSLRKFKNENDSESSVEQRADTEKNIPTENASSDLQPGPVVIPRLKRRGLFGQLTLIAEVEDARNYGRQTKWFLTFIVAIAALPAPMGSAIFFRERPCYGPVPLRKRYPLIICLQHP